MISSFVICGWDCGPGESTYTTAWIVFLSSGGLTVGSAVYDLATVKSAVNNRNRRFKTKVTFSAGPVFFTDIKAPGIGLTVRF